MSEKVKPALSRQAWMASRGNPAKYLTLFRRSSAIAVTGSPFITSAADAPG